MKKSVLLAISLLLALAIVSCQDRISPRRDTNCENRQEVQYSGWYFNDQQCLYCLNQTCHKCKGWYECEGCNDEYELFTDKSLSLAQPSYCRRCDTGLSTKNQKTIKNCCWSPIDVTKGYTYSAAVHSTKCIDNENQIKQHYILYGHFCHEINYCKSYTEYGRCKQCEDGHYLTQDYKCEQCDNLAWDDTQFNDDPFIIPTLNWQSRYQIDSSGNFILDTNGNKQLYSTIPYSGWDLNGNAASGTYNLITRNTYCKKCYGPYECVQCGIHWGTYWQTNTYSSSRGSYLAVNSLRETYDKNIGRNPSFCRQCNEGCDCSGPENLCPKCVLDKFWYYDPNQHKCLPCNTTCTNSGTDKINCCEECMWDDFMQGPRCTKCKSQHKDFDANGNVKSLMGVIGYEDLMKPNNQKFQLCYTCDRAVGYTEYQLQNTGDTYIIPGANKKDITEKVSGHPACTQCTIVPAQYQVGQYQNGAGQTVNIDDPEFKIRYVQCTECQNGYEKVIFGSSEQSTSNYKFTHSLAATTTIDGTAVTAGTVITWKVQKVECRKCQQLIKNQDAKDAANTASQFPDDANLKNRYQYVRRCKMTSTTNRYQITQCGNPNNLAEDYMANGADPEAVQRGPEFPSEQTGTVSTIWMNSLSQYFDVQGGTKGKLSSFLVQTQNTAVGSTCLQNIWKCRRIKTQPTIPITDADEPKCDQCFMEYGYVKTRKEHCRRCDNSESNEIQVGCSKCEPDPTTGNEDKLRCIECYNHRDGITDVINNIWYKNYYYDQNQHTCTECNTACKICLNENKECQECQSNWGLKDERKLECDRCIDPNCKECNFNVTKCNVCNPGYRKVAINTGSGVINERVHCEKCEEGCLACDTDRKSCTKCNTNTHYQHEGKCKKKRHGCVNWEIDGGQCQFCEYGYRMVDGWCYKCFNELSGFIDCPAQCQQISYPLSNVRRDSNVAPTPTPTQNTTNTTQPNSRILQLLDDELSWNSW